MYLLNHCFLVKKGAISVCTCSVHAYGEQAHAICVWASMINCEGLLLSLVYILSCCCRVDAGLKEEGGGR